MERSVLSAFERSIVARDRAVGSGAHPRRAPSQDEALHHGGVRLARINRLVLRAALVVLAAPIVALVVVSVVVAGTMVMNNVRLSDWKKDLFALPASSRPSR